MTTVSSAVVTYEVVEDQMGLRNGMDAVFGLHHFAHAHNAEVGRDSLGGLDVKAMAAGRKAR